MKQILLIQFLFWQMNLIIDTMIIYSMKYVLDTSKEERLSLLSLVLFPLHLYACKQQPSHNTQTHTHTFPSLNWFSWKEKSPLRTSWGEQRFWLHGAPVSADTDRQSHSCLCMCFQSPSHLWKTYSHAESSISNVRI